jgi:hypothetical protein
MDRFSVKCSDCGFKKWKGDMRYVTEWHKDIWTRDFEPHKTHYCCRKCLSIKERDAKRNGELVKKGEEGYRARGYVFFIIDD